MTKIILFNVRDEHIPFIEEWSANTGVETVTKSYGLSASTVSDCEGFDGVTVAEPGKFDSSLYPILKSYGIKNVAQRTAGFENFDLEEAKNNDIIITNVSAYSPESIAEFTLYMILRAIRRGKDIEKQVTKQDFSWTTKIRGRLLKEMKVGILGTGKIGGYVAQLVKGFGAEVYGYDLYRNSNLDGVLEYKDTVEELVAECDIVSLHMPSTKDNFHLFNKDLFAKFKKGSYLINAGRGQLVNSIDLLSALDSGILAGAALDTYENEATYIPGDFSGQLIEDAVFVDVLNHEKIDFTHHTAYYTETSVKNMIQFALNSTLEIINTGTTKDRLN